MAETAMAEGDLVLTDRERLLSLEMELRAFRELVSEQRASDRSSWTQELQNLRNQVIQLASHHERFATTASVEKIEERLDAVTKAVQELQRVVVPRDTVQAKFDGVQVRQEAISAATGKLQESLVKLADEFSASIAHTEKLEAHDKNKRDHLIAILGVGAAIVGILVAIYFNSHTSTSPTPPTVVIEQPTTSTTALGGHR